MKKKIILVLCLIMMVLILIAGCTSTTPTVGIIDVNSTPTGAKVYLNGVDTGQVTPIILTNVEAGILIVKLDKFHYKIWEDTAVTVNANETTYLNPLLTYATLSTITLQPGPEGMDTFVNSLSPDTNWGSYFMCDVGNTTTAIVRSYIQFDLSSVPENARVVDADLQLYQYQTFGTEDFIVDLRKVTSEWQEGTINWNSQPTYSTEVEYSSTITIGAVTWKFCDIDDLVQGWLDGTITNFGMVLKDTDESSVNAIAYFYTSDFTIDTTKRPKLVIDYYIP